MIIQKAYRFLMMICLLALSACSLSCFFEHGHADVALMCFQVGVFWWVFVNIIFRYVAETFINSFSRFLYVMSVVCGMMVSAIACVMFLPNVLLSALSFLMVVPWLFMFGRYIEQYEQYEEADGQGLVRKGAYESPPLSEWTAGSILLSAGLGPNQYRLPGRHAELNLVNRMTGELCTFSNFIEHGCKFTSSEEAYQRFVDQKEKFWLVDTVEPWTPEKLEKAWEIAKVMEEENRRHQIESGNAFILGIHEAFCWLGEHGWTPQRWLIARLRAMWTGYDWRGVLFGADSKHPEWTCISSVVVLLRRVGFKTFHYGIGLFGFGGGFADPTIPLSLMADRRNFKVRLRPGYVPEPVKKYSLQQTLLHGLTGWPIVWSGARKSLADFRIRMQMLLSGRLI